MCCKKVGCSSCGVVMNVEVCSKTTGGLEDGEDFRGLLRYVLAAFYVCFFFQPHLCNQCGGSFALRCRLPPQNKNRGDKLLVVFLCMLLL